MAWLQIDSGNPAEILLRRDSIDAAFGHGDQGRIILDLRAPLPQEIITQIQNALQAAAVTLTEAIRQVGQTLIVTFRKQSPGFGVVFGIIAGIGLLYIIHVSVQKDVPIAETIFGKDHTVLMVLGGALAVLLLTRR